LGRKRSWLRHRVPPGCARLETRGDPSFRFDPVDPPLDDGIPGPARDRKIDPDLTFQLPDSHPAAVDPLPIETEESADFPGEKPAADPFQPGIGLEVMDPVPGIVGDGDAGFGRFEDDLLDEAAFAELGKDAFREKLRTSIREKARHIKDDDPYKKHGKLIRFALSRGFDPDEANALLDEMNIF